jgi:hypothetical protein
VVERLAARPGSRDGDAQVLFYLGLADELRQALGAQIRVQRNVFGQRLARDDASYIRAPESNFEAIIAQAFNKRVMSLGA